MIHFSLHTEFSYLSGASRIKQYVQHCKQNNITHLAITDYGTLSGILDLQTECEKENIKPIFGCEVYIARDKSKKNIPDDIKKKIIEDSEVGKAESELNKYAKENDYTISEREIYSLNLWAMNNVGLKNLYKITSQAWVDGFFYKPRTDISSIIKDNEGLCVGTGSIDSYINKMILAGNIIDAMTIVMNLYDKFEERLVIELPVQYNVYSKQLVDFYLMIKNDIPKSTYIPSSDVHYLTKDDVYKHRVVSSISRKYDNGKDVDIHSNGLSGNDNYFHSEQEIIDRLLKLGVQNPEQYVQNTKTLASKFDAKVDVIPFAMITPTEIGIPNDKSPEEYLEQLCNESKVWNIIPESSKVLYQERTRKELEALKKQNFTKYVLYIKCILDMARSINCEIGPGRGSAAGSIVNWHLQNTNVDPIEYNLLFERYIDPDRVNPPDNDIDIDPSKRAELIELMRQRWGYNNVGFINNFSKLGGKSAWNDVCRILKVPIPETRELAKHITDEDDDNKGHVLEHSFKNDAFKNIDKKYPNILKYSLGIEGLYRQTGIHAAGVICADKELWNYAPIETRSDGDNRVIVCAFDKDTIESTGLLKVDLLGLDTVKTISACVNEIRKTQPQFDINNIDYNDQNIINEFTKKNFDGIFQYDSPASRKLCAGLDKFNSFIDVSHITALNRPGPLDSGMAYSYIHNCNANDHTTTTYHHKLDHITKDTYGILVYQEQVMRVFADIQGHPKPDKMRKLIAKSKGVEEIEKYRSEFIAGSLSKHPDIPEDVLNKLFSDIVTFGNYAFNLSHSVAYAKIAYIQQWLKFYYPLEFWYTMIKNAKDDDKRAYAYSAKKQGIEFITADINLSEGTLSYSKEKNCIVGGLLDIKGIGEKAAQEISNNKPFTSFDDFYTRCPKRQVNAGAVKALVMSGAMNEYVKNTKVFLESFDDLANDYNKKSPSFTNWDDKLEALSFEQKDFPKWKKKEMALLVNTSALIDPFEDVMKELSQDIVMSPISIITPVNKNKDDATKSTFDRMFTGHWIRGIVTDISFFEHKSKSEPTEREVNFHFYGENIYYINLLTANGETIRVSILPSVWKRIPNFKCEVNNSLLVFIQTPYQSEKRVRVVWNLSNIDLKDSLYRSLFVKTHPINKYLEKFDDKEKRVALANPSKIYQLVEDNKLVVFNVYGTIVGFEIRMIKSCEIINFAIMTMNGIVFVQYFSTKQENVDDMLKHYCVGDLVKVKVNISIYAGSFQLSIKDKGDIQNVK